MSKKCIWRPIEKEPKRVPSGYMRIYTFKPSEIRPGAINGYTLPRLYEFSRHAGSRVCDMFMDIPKPESES